MKFEQPLVRGILVRRYKRFLADVRLDDGSIVVAHCPNTGSMLSVDRPGSEIWLSPSTQPTRTLQFTWELIRVSDTLVGINTARPCSLVAEAIMAGRISELAGYDVLHREVRYGRNSRIDILLEGGGRPACYVEVKNVTLKRDGVQFGKLEFPDATTVRGRKHLIELTDIVRGGMRGVMLFLAQRNDGDRFAIAADIDPEYASVFSAASAAGVEMLCYDAQLSLTEIRVDRPLPALGVRW